MRADVVIIGGGIAGLACGAALAGRGLRTVVLERSGMLGGRARSWRDEQTGDTVDIGPHILLTEYRNMLQLLEDLGTRDRVVWQQGKFITLVDRPHPVDVHMHRLPAPLHFMPSMLTLPQVRLADLASNARLLWQVMRLDAADAARLDAVDAVSFLRKMGVSEPFIDWFWRSACMSIMNVPLERCSAGALMSFFRFMIGKSGYRVGFAATGLGELYAPAATRRIENTGGRVLLNTAVDAILGERRASGVRLSDGGRIDARYCVAALPPQELLPLLPDHWRAAHPALDDLAEFRPSPYISSYLWFDRKLTADSFWARVWSPDNLNYDSYDLSNIRSELAGRPSLIASNIVYSYRAHGLGDEEIVQATLRELAAALPAITPAKLLHSRVHRIPMAIPAPYPGSERLRPPTQSPVAGLLYAGDWVRTGLPASMESAVRAAYLAAEAVLAGEARPTSLTAPLPPAESVVRLLGGR